MVKAASFFGPFACSSLKKRALDSYYNKQVLDSHYSEEVLDSHYNKQWQEC